MNDDNLTGEVRPRSTDDRSKAPQTALTSPMGIFGLSVNYFTPGDRQAPISLRCVEPSHMGNPGLDPKGFFPMSDGSGCAKCSKAWQSMSCTGIWVFQAVTSRF